MSKYILTIEGDFEKGECEKCPIDAKYLDAHPICCHESSESCPLEEVEQGEWIEDGIAVICNQCHKSFVMEQGSAELNFCLHCGKPMKGGKE